MNAIFGWRQAHDLTSGKWDTMATHPMGKPLAENGSKKCPDRGMGLKQQYQRLPQTTTQRSTKVLILKCSRDTATTKTYNMTATRTTTCSRYGVTA